MSADSAWMFHDPALTNTHRRVLLALALTLPRWLWPEPSKQQHLHANALPQLLKLKERSQALMANENVRTDLVNRGEAGFGGPDGGRGRSQSRAVHRDAAQLQNVQPIGVRSC